MCVWCVCVWVLVRVGAGECMLACVRVCWCVLHCDSILTPRMLQDLPFLIFACVFMGAVRRLQLSAVLALGLALLGTAGLGVTCVRER